MKEEVQQVETRLITPYSGEIVNLLVPRPEAVERREAAAKLPYIVLTERSLCDLEILATGGFSPLDRFMGEQDYQRVLGEMRLADGRLYPMPITLPVDEPPPIGARIALRSPGQEILAEMTVEEAFRWDLATNANELLGTTDTRHPLVAEMYRWGGWNVSGPLRVFELPAHFDFQDYRLTPEQTRRALVKLGRSNVVAFQTRNPLHRVHEELTKRAIQDHGAVLLLHPVVGVTKPDDVDHFTRVRTYKALATQYYESGQVLLALLPLAMRFAGPREALWHAVTRRNYGANYMIVGRDHASPGLDTGGKPFYQPYEAQAMVERYADETGVEPVAFQELVYVPNEGRYLERSEVPEGSETSSISGSQLREEYLDSGKPLPEWFTRTEVAEILRNSYPPSYKQGVCIWFTGLSGAGKSTTAWVLSVLLQERGRDVTMLDGDIVRTHLSKGLGFDKADRDTNIRRIGFVASQIVRHGGVVICAAISPYRATRNDVRNMIGGDNFIEVFVDTPLEVCESRDIKGLYSKARRGELSGFTGIDDPYEMPENPEIRLETVETSAESNAHQILEYLVSAGFVLQN